MTHRYSFGIFPDDWTNAMRLRQRVQGTVQLHRASLTDLTLSLVTFADLHTSLDATLTGGPGTARPMSEAYAGAT